MYDLLIKGGHVLDPGQNLNGQMDIAITGGKFAAIQADIPATEARRVVEIRGANRYVVPGLIDLHTHVAYGATTAGVGMGCPAPDTAGVHSGVTTVVDAGSVGVANIGTFAAHLIPKAKTRIVVFANVGIFAHTTPGMADFSRIEEIDRKAIAGAVEQNPGLIGGFKVRLVGPVVHERGEDVAKMSKEIASEHNVPLMVHFGDMRAPDPTRATELTKFMLKTFTEGDIVTHLTTPSPGGFMDPTDPEHKVLAEVKEARENGVTLDPALGRGNFGFEVAKRQAQMGFYPDTISSDITGGGRTQGVGLLNSMSKFMAVGYKFEDLVRMATAGAARALRMEDQIGAIAVGREADLSIVEIVSGSFKDTDTARQEFTFDKTVVPVQTIRAGELFAPDWGPFPWGWLPQPA
jgi:dihydroorotase